MCTNRVRSLFLVRYFFAPSNPSCFSSGRLETSAVTANTTGRYTQIVDDISPRRQPQPQPHHPRPRPLGPPRPRLHNHVLIALPCPCPFVYFPFFSFWFWLFGVEQRSSNHVLFPPCPRPTPTVCHARSLVETSTLSASYLPPPTHSYHSYSHSKCDPGTFCLLCSPAYWYHSHCYHLERGHTPPPTDHRATPLSPLVFSLSRLIPSCYRPSQSTHTYRLGLSPALCLLFPA